VIDPQIRVGIDVGCKAHRVGIANPAGKILEEFDISHTDAGFQDFFRRIEHHKHKSDLPVAVAMEGGRESQRLLGLPGAAPSRCTVRKRSLQGRTRPATPMPRHRFPGLPVPAHRRWGRLPCRRSRDPPRSDSYRSSTS